MPRAATAIVLIAIGLALALWLVGHVGATPLAPALAWQAGEIRDDGASWWWAEGCRFHPQVVTVPPGLGGGWCDAASGVATAYANAGWDAVFIDGRQVAGLRKVWLPEVWR